MKTTWQEIDSLMVISNCRKSPRLLAGTQRGEKKLSYQSSAPPSQLKLTLKKPKKSKPRGILWQSDRFVIYDSFKHTNSGYIFLPTGQIQDLTEERFVLVENVIVYFRCNVLLGNRAEQSPLSDSLSSTKLFLLHEDSNWIIVGHNFGKFANVLFCCPT